MPAHKLDLSKKEKYIPADVLKKIYEAVDNLMDLAYIQYHTETGLRVSEVLGTRLSDINWEKRKTNTFDFKKDSWRMVFWPPFVGSTLKMYLNNRDKSKETRDQRERLFPFSEKTANRILKR